MSTGDSVASGRSVISSEIESCCANPIAEQTKNNIENDTLKIFILQRCNYFQVKSNLFLDKPKNYIQNQKIA